MTLILPTQNQLDPDIYFALRCRNTMASVAATPDIGTVDMSSLTLSDDVPGFFRISPELRNERYED
jgi:hypothetical protein